MTPDPLLRSSCGSTEASGSLVRRRIAGHEDLHDAGTDLRARDPAAIGTDPRAAGGAAGAATFAPTAADTKHRHKHSQDETRRRRSMTGDRSTPELADPRLVLSSVLDTARQDPLQSAPCAHGFSPSRWRRRRGSPPGNDDGQPEENLPPTITRLTHFGERASWSPDGKRIAFMEKSFGDAYEVDVATGIIRLLTHYAHPEFPARPVPTERRLLPHWRPHLHRHRHHAIDATRRCGS